MSVTIADQDDTSPTLPTLPTLPHRSRPEGPLARVRGGPGTSVRDWAAASVAGERKGGNEDRWGVRDDRMFAVADGMGGHGGGDRAAQITIDTLLDPEQGDRPWRERLLAVDRAVRTWALPDAPAAGSTLVAVLCSNAERATVIGIGDSRVYRLRAGRLEPLTRDHTVRGALLGAGIDADRHADAREARGLTSYLGIGPEHLKVDLVDVPIAAGDRFLLCSDGVYGRLAHLQLRELLAAGSCDEVARALVRPRPSDRRRDDATALVIDLS